MRVPQTPRTPRQYWPQCTHFLHTDVSKAPWTTHYCWSLLTNCISKSVIIWWPLKKGCHIVATVEWLALLHLGVSFHMARSCIFSLDTNIQMGVSACAAEIHSASLLPTHWQIWATTVKGERGVSHAAYQNRLPRLKRPPLPLQTCHWAKSLGRGTIFAMQVLWMLGKE